MPGGLTPGYAMHLVNTGSSRKTVNYSFRVKENTKTFITTITSSAGTTHTQLLIACLKLSPIPVLTIGDRYFTCMELRLVSFLLNEYVMLCC